MTALTLKRPQTFNYKAQIIAQVVVEGDDNVKAFHTILIGLEKILFVIDLFCNGILYFTEVIDFMLGDMKAKASRTSTWGIDWGISLQIRIVFWKVWVLECGELVAARFILV